MLEIRPTTRADCEAFYSKPPQYRIRAHTGLWNGEIIGIGGIAYPPDGNVVAFADLRAEAKHFPVALHKLALRVVAEAKAAGAHKIIARMSETEPTAERWLARLGFSPVFENDKAIWQWRN